MRHKNNTSLIKGPHTNMYIYITFFISHKLLLFMNKTMGFAMIFYNDFEIHVLKFVNRFSKLRTFYM